jgi:hypothetical protein
MDLRDGPCPFSFRLTDGHNQLDGRMRWALSAIVRLVDGHNQLDGRMRWMRPLFLSCVTAMYTA